jgi:hypothetical protein
MMAVVYRWTGSVTPLGRGADYRLRRATELALSVLADRELVVTEAIVDCGHDTGYESAFEQHFLDGGPVISPRFVHSHDDRRIQLADLVATAAKQMHFPSKQFFEGVDKWLEAFAGPRLLSDEESWAPCYSFEEP